MWRSPWGYKESFTIAIGLALLGLVWHFVLGPIPPHTFTFPANLIGGLVVLLASLIIGWVGHKHKRHPLSFFCGYKAAIGSMTVWLVILVIMGLTRQIEVHQAMAQGPLPPGLVHWLGWSYMLSTWYFLILYLYVLFCLGCATTRFLLGGFRKRGLVRYTAFLLNHLGLYIALWAGLMGAHDIQRYRMQVSTESEYPEWRGVTPGDPTLHELPLAVELHKFTLEEYPPKVMAIYNETGDVLPLDRPWQLPIEEVPTQSSFEDWDVEVLQHLPYSSPVVTKDSVVFVEFGSLGACHGAKIRATNRVTGNEVNGWIGAGSFLIPFRSLKLTDEVSLVMAEPEPKQYYSDVTVYAPDGEVKSGTIAVNSPMKFKGWWIYQLNYDQEKGRWSHVSVFELVKDPWLPLVYIGLLTMMLGAISLFMTNKVR